MKKKTIKWTKKKKKNKKEKWKKQNMKKEGEETMLRSSPKQWG